MAVKNIIAGGFGSFSEVKYIPPRGFLAMVPVFDTDPPVWIGRAPAAQDSLYPRRAPVEDTYNPRSSSADTHIGRYRERVQ